MNETEKSLLHSHVISNKPRTVFLNSYHSFENGENIRFSHIEQKSDYNCEFQLNENSKRKIWFSQLSQFFYAHDMERLAATIMINGKEKCICEYNHLEFWSSVQHKEFKVARSGPYYVINWMSNTAILRGIDTEDNAISYIKQCIKNNTISEIGDLLKFAYCYDLIEVDHKG